MRGIRDSSSGCPLLSLLPCRARRQQSWHSLCCPMIWTLGRVSLGRRMPAWSRYSSTAPEPVKAFETSAHDYFCASLSMVGLLIHAAVGSLGGLGLRFPNRQGLAV